MAELRRQVGFLSAVRKTSLISLLWPEGLGALAFGGGGALILLELSSLQVRMEIAKDALVVIAPLLGVVLASLTLGIVLTANDFLEWLARSKQDSIAFYRPFIFAIGIEIWTMIALIGYRATAADMPIRWEYWLFVLVLVLVVFALLDILAVARSVLMHKVVTSALMEANAKDDDVSEL